MSLPDPRSGSLFIWVTTFVLLLAILAGGICLVLYISLPQTEAPSWLSIAGVLLVCLPWFFWLLTFVYRLITRTCGFRIGGGGGGGPGSSVAGASSGGGGAASVQNAATDGASETVGATSPATSPGGSRRVHFGAAVVVGEQDGEDGEDGQDGLQNKENQMSLINSSNDISINSNESERPLALSMVS